jgi:hypothetical protein
MVYSKHIAITEDEKGGYLPKNSHDNLKAKVAGSILLGRDDHKHISLNLIFKVMWYRPADLVFFFYLLGGTVLNRIAGLFLPLFFIFAYAAAFDKGKIRPDWFEKNPDLSRWRFIFRKKRLEKTITTRDGWNKVYTMLANNQTYVQRLHQNDGKHLYTIMFLALCEKSSLARIAFKRYNHIMGHEYGTWNYMNVVWWRYFGFDHPVVQAWDGIDLGEDL